ncbi:hypothetical protein M408DRAFT_332224 [Serendipita vermifera MAFF 305830]|uniref:Uncharacterized protein n=1 Tax=Serendipita vermifera MAFF 305830 TaxID=933852 RepID=A0A0C2X2R6_SERVB|nr:hypothetical protein M408DRAFT_332224 [Serendipita vermifera MAFF 305830]
MTVTTASVNASSFAALLKQSKFASYSPSIAQVYTTHGGHAARGDWGVKRPLSVRKRGRALLIQSIDSREQQTEFRSGESEANMVERWQETGMNITASDKGRESKQWKAQYDNRPSKELAIDSEFCAYTPPPQPDMQSNEAGAALRLKTSPSIEGTPDFNLMSTEEFDQYLERVRKLRPAFRKYLQNRRVQGLDNEGQSPSLYRMRCINKGDNLANGFLKEISHQLHGSPHSQTLEPYPHRNGGLFYPTPNSFQTSLLYPTIPARFTSVTTSSSMRVSAAGMAINVPPANTDNTRPLDWERQSVLSGVAPIRFVETALMQAPEAVATAHSDSSEPSFSAPAGRSLRRNQPDLTEPPFTYPTGLKGMNMQIDGAVVRDQTIRSNQHRPGSLMYSLSAETRSRAKFSQGPKPPAMSDRIRDLDGRLSRNRVPSERDREGMVGALDALLKRVQPEEK